MSLGLLAFLAGRGFSMAVFALTWGYGVTAFSPFAFDMFVKPRLLPWLESFVAWHHVWFLAAYLVSVATLWPVLGSGRAHLASRRSVAWWAAATYVGIVGAVASHLLMNPRLPLLGSGSHDLVVVPGALLPLLWLAAIDHLDGWPTLEQVVHGEVTAQPRVAVAAVGSAALVWFVATAREALIATTSAGALAWTIGRVWAFGLALAVFAIAAALLALISGVAASRRRAAAWEYGLTLAALGLGIAELFRRVVFPPLMLSPADAAMVAAPAGMAAATTFGGLRLRTTTRAGHAGTGLDLLLSFRGRPAVRRVLLVAVPVATAVVLTLVERIDWAMILRNVVVLLQAVLVFGLALDATRHRQGQPWSLRLLVAPLAAAMLATYLVPVTGRAAASASGDLRADPRQLLDRYRASDGFTSLAATALVEQQEADPGFYRDLVAAEVRFSNLDPRPPAETLTALEAGPGDRPPHVFLFVIDSLRRDYLSPYNDQVSFTPAIERWARDQFVFRNAFTRYGGTWLSIPSIWTGMAVTRRWATVLPKINAIEQLVVDAGFDFVINDFTVADLLRPETRRTFLDPTIKSVDTDLCQNLASLQAHIDTRGSAQPLFAYLAPMNVHILNTRTGGAGPEAAYSGFYPPYASRLQRIDGCFGAFIDFLRARGMDDDSVIILTSDHGDSLGTDGRWGHQFYLLPENMRVPLIVQLPARHRAQVTADLGRLAFLSDIVPSLFALLGYPVRDLGPAFGAPLFVDADAVPTSRRRDSFVIMSSYGSSYGVLRRNGRNLYMVDLVNRKEGALAVDRDPLGEEVPASDALRRSSRRAILDGLADIERLFRSP